MTRLSPDERARLRAACEAAEKRTSARFELVTVPVSDRYTLYPVVYGAIAGLTALGALALFWPELSLRMGFLAAAALFAAASFLFGWLPLRLMLVPRYAKSWECWELAHRSFASRILAQTDRKTGILLFVSLGEHYVEVVTDRDVDLKVLQSTWDAIIKDFTAAAKEKRLADGLVAAVDACAKVLGTHYPAK
ncbi:MAG TPA: TPM domain-containing protein [Rhizomicrobium sp.]